MAKVNLSKSRPATPQKPISPTTALITVDQLINRTRGQVYGVEHLKKAANQIEGLSQILYDAQDRGLGLRASDDPDACHLSEVAAGVWMLMSAISTDIERIAGYMGELCDMAQTLFEHRKGAKA